MYTTDPPQIRDLGEQDISSILGRNTVGRLAFMRGEEIDILPIQYVFHGGAIYGRTGPGGKLLAIGRDQTVVAFEVDEIESAHSWRSVLAHGTFHVIEEEPDQEEWLRALGTVRRLHHTAFRENDNRPERSKLFKVLIRTVTGRAAG